MAKRFFYQGKEIDKSAFDSLSQIAQMGQAGMLGSSGLSSIQNVLQDYQKRSTLNNIISSQGLAKQLSTGADSAPIAMPTEQAKPDYGLLGNIVNGIATSGKNLLQDVGAGFAGLAGAAGVQGATELGTKILNADERGKALLNGNSGDAWKAGIKDFGFAASLVPAGGALGAGIGGLAKAGALSGGLAGLGQSNLTDVGSTANDVLGGAALGGATGAALGYGAQKLGQLANKAKVPVTPKGGATSITPEMIKAYPELANVTDAEARVINPIKGGLERITNKYAGSQFEREGAAAVVAKDITDALGNPVNKDIVGKMYTPKAQGRLITRLGNNLTSEVNAAIENLPKNIKLSSGTNAISGNVIYNELAKDSAFGTSAARDVLVNDIKPILTGTTKIKEFAGKTSFTLPDLYNLRSYFNNTSSTAAKNAANGLGAAVGSQEANYAAANATRSILRDVATTSPEVAQVEALFNKLHAYNTIEPGIFKSIYNPGSQWTFNLGTSIPLPMTAARGLASNANKIANNLPNMSTGKISPETLTKISSGLTTGAKVLPKTVGINQGTSQDTTGTLGGTYGTIDTGTSSLAPDNSVILNELINSGYSPTEAKSLLATIAPSTSSAKVTDAGRKMNAAKSQLESALKILGTGKVTTGPLVGSLDAIGSDLGLASPTNDAYRAAISLARTQLKNALIGGNMTETEISSLMGSMPDPNDTPQRARIKINNMLDYIKGFMSNETSSSSSSDLGTLSQLLSDFNGTTTAQ